MTGLGLLNEETVLVLLAGILVGLLAYFAVSKLFGPVNQLKSNLQSSGNSGTFFQLWMKVAVSL